MKFYVLPSLIFYAKYNIKHLMYKLNILKLLVIKCIGKGVLTVAALFMP